MRWYKFEDKIPNVDSVILVKIKNNIDRGMRGDYNWKYNIVTVVAPQPGWHLPMSFYNEDNNYDCSDLEGWCPISEIERCEKWN